MCLNGLQCRRLELHDGCSDRHHRNAGDLRAPHPLLMKRFCPDTLSISHLVSYETVSGGIIFSKWRMCEWRITKWRDVPEVPAVVNVQPGFKSCLRNQQPVTWTLWSTAFSGEAEPNTRHKPSLALLQLGRVHVCAASRTPVQGKGSCREGAPAVACLVCNDRAKQHLPSIADTPRQKRMMELMKSPFKVSHL